MRTILPPLSAALLAATLPVQAQDPDGKAGPTGSGASNAAVDNGPGTANSVADLNVRVVRQWHRAAGVNYNDIWGWTAPDGREFAYVGEVGGIWFVETTDPQNMRTVGQWSAPRSTWRDYANLGGYVYAVSEGHRGIRILDMRNPDQPRDVGYVEVNAITNTHNITSDPATGHLYLSGTNQGVMIYDASQNPEAPRYVGNWNITYTHDCCVLRGRAFLSNGSTRRTRIMDASNPANLIEISNFQSPAGYNHNVWVSDDESLLCVTDEIARRWNSPHMTVWDISNPRSPVKRGDYDLGTIVHNVFILGRTAYMSHYTDGVHVVDLTDPAQPTRIASYDTSTVSGGYNGCWGVHPFADHGLVYASDMQNGLYVLEIQAGHMNRYGAGTPGTNGGVPRATFQAATPRVGATGLRLSVDNLEPNASAWLIVGWAQGNVNVAGVDIHVDPQASYATDFAADAQGHADVALPIPADANLGNQRVYMQIVARDSQAANGFSASRGMWFGIAQ